MSIGWEDRLRGAALTSPDGTRLDFDYENVSKSIDKKTTAFDFPDVDGTYIQESGHTGRRYPMRIFFWGDDHDLKSAAFEEMLLQKGIFELEHPIYGVVEVVPFGTITQRDNLKTAANQSIIELTFWETIGLIYPESEDDEGAETLNAIDEYNQEFDDNIDLTSAVETSSFKNSYDVFLKKTKSALQKVADSQADVQKQFDAFDKSITDSLDLLVAKPALLIFQTKLMIQSPARAITKLNARLTAYKDLADSFTTGDKSTQTNGNDNRPANDFAASDVFVSTSITGSIISVINNEFVTKTEAIEAAENIIEQFDAAVVWRDDNFQSLEEIDTGGSYQKLQNAVALAAGYLVQISFSLKQERRIVLDRNRTFVDLIAELYGETDAQYDFFINSNNLSGDEIKELPAGREIVYYI